jgi:2-amino-4-hydroxy-6-hydroxymethyldihydropteridine diphosphokinase
LSGSDPEPLHAVYVLLGSNIEPEAHFLQAFDKLCGCCNLEAVSTVWETQAVGSHGPNFLNAAALIRTHLSAVDLKYQVLRPLENEMGRIRLPDKNAPRTIDLDILVYDLQIQDNGIWYQAHLAVPLAELLPDLVNPHTGQSLGEIALGLCQNQNFVIRPEIKFRG